MTEAKRVITIRMIDPNLDHYDSFFDHAWAADLASRVPSQLADAFDSLFFAWKEAANTQRLPWLMIQQMKAFAGGWARSHKSHIVQIVEMLKNWVREQLDGKLRRADKKTILGFIKTADQRLRIAEQQENVEFPAVSYWKDLIGQDEFQLSISGSQGLAYCGLVFAYEWFVVSCFRALGGAEKFRPNQDPFWTEFEKLLGRDSKPDYWNATPVEIARLTRNCIASCRPGQ